MKDFPGLKKLFVRATGLYPAPFRELFAEDMASLFVSRCRDVYERRGSLGVYAFGVRSVLGVLAGALIEHLRTGKESERQTTGRRRRIGGIMNPFFQDLRFGLRTLWTSRTYTVLAVVTLAFGIAVNATLFSVVKQLLFDDLPIRDPESFAFVWAVNERAGEDRSPMSLPDFARLESESDALADVAAFLDESFILTGEDEPRRVTAFRVSDNFHRVWGTEVVLGRGFQPGDDRPGGEPVTIVSHGFWERQFGADPGVLGQTLKLDGVAFTVIGVLSPKMEFGDISRIDLWVPLEANPLTAARDDRRTFVTARLAEGANVSEAREEVRAIAARLSQDYPDSHEGWSFRLSPTSEELVNEEDSALLLVAGLSVAFVLLIACANVANMLMARASSRSKEVALRLALGANRLRLVRQFLTEGFLMAAAAAALGLVLTRALLEALVLVTAGNHWLYRSAAVDTDVLLFTLGVSTLTPFVFGLLPSLRASRPNVTEALKEGGRSSVGGKALRLRGSLVGTQIVMAIVLMVVTGLLVRTVIELRTMDLGFDPDGVIAARLALPESKYATAESQQRFFDELLERTQRVTSVQGASLVSRHPLEYAGGQRAFTIRGSELDESRQRPMAQVFTASADYFRVMQIPLVRGRVFEASDTESAPRVVVVNQEAADLYWKGADPMGASIRTASSEEGSWAQVVGIVGNVVDISRDDTDIPQVYFVASQEPTRAMTLVARTAADPGDSSGAIRAEIEALDEDLAADVRTLSEIKEELFESSNAIIALFLIFAGFALVMAAIGIYGVMSYSVSQRRHEIGIRMALGANASDVMKMISAQGMRLILIGGAVGLVGALLVGRLLQSVLIGVTASDPLTFGSVAGLLGLVALVANHVPARRATRIDPIATLRAE